VGKKRVEDKDSREQIHQDVERFLYDPLGYVIWAFQWGEPDTPLAEFPDGPDIWQTEFLDYVGRTCLDAESAVQLAVKSGHGVGKSTMAAWMILWAMSTRPYLQGVVTANTGQQLRSKTWSALNKWHDLAMNRHWFKWTPTKFYHVQYPETWKVDAVTWSPENSDAFAGTHEKYVLMLFDEASQIHDNIWEVAHGALTSPKAIWMAFGNPTRNTGGFHECFGTGKQAHRWKQFTVDARKSAVADHTVHDHWIEDYGLDSDFVKVRVLGEFPGQASDQFLATEYVQESFKRRYRDEQIQHMPIVLGVDVASYGGDESVVTVRQGLVVHEQIADRGLSTPETSDMVERVILRYRPDGICIDCDGIGTAVADELAKRGHEIHRIYGMEKARNPKLYFNKRAQMWGDCRECVHRALSIPNYDPVLESQLTQQQYHTRRGSIQLISKADMRAAGMDSPDRADSLVYTFAINPQKRDADDYDEIQGSRYAVSQNTSVGLLGA